MTVELPLFFQAAVIAASISIVVCSVVALIVLFQLRKKANRVVEICEALKGEFQPLAAHMHSLLEKMHEISWSVQQDLKEVEELMHAARSWAQRAGHLASEVGSAVGSPVVSAGHKVSMVSRGISAFMRTLFHRGNGDPVHQKEN